MSLRSATIRLAHTNPALRPHLLPLLRSAGSYQDYVERKKKEGEKPLPKEEWEARTQGGGKDKSEKKDTSGPVKDTRLHTNVHKIQTQADTAQRTLAGLAKKLTEGKRLSPEKEKEALGKAQSMHSALVSNARYLHRDMEEYLRKHGESDDPKVQNTLDGIYEQLGSLEQAAKKAGETEDTHADSKMPGAATSALAKSADSLGAAMSRVMALYGTLFR